MGGIYLIRDDGDLVEMRESLYDSEDVLQRLLGQYPDLLAGDQIDDSKPRRWVLVSREMGVPGEEDGSGRWSLDHLFLDQDAIPTLVEVKRSTDTRIRRDVVGQMLDYAANAVAYWPVEEIRAKFEATCSARQVDPEEELAGLLVDEADPAEFWQKVKTNLQAGRVLMLFVADEIPKELRRIVEFLNKQMDPAEVLAVEIKQYLGQGMKTLVPRVIGQTAAAERIRPGGTSERTQIEDSEYFEVLSSRCGQDEIQVVRRLVEWSAGVGMESCYIRGSNHCSFIPILLHGGNKFYPISVQTSGYFVLQMRWLVTKPPFDHESKRAELLRLLNDIPGVVIGADRMVGMPRIPLSSLVGGEKLQHLLAALQWMIEAIRVT